MYFTPQGEGEKRRGSMPLGLFLFIMFLFFRGHLTQTPGFRSAKKYVLQTIGQHEQYLRSVSADSPKLDERRCRKLLRMQCNEKSLRRCQQVLKDTDSIELLGPEQDKQG